MSRSQVTGLIRRIHALFAKPAKRRRPDRRCETEPLETRTLKTVAEVTSVALTSAFGLPAGFAVQVVADDTPTNVTVTREGGAITIRDQDLGRAWTFFASQVWFYGGAANDRFVNTVPDVAVSAYGRGGDDHLESSNGSDILSGGAGNDVLRGGAGGDSLNGGEGHDLLFGESGNDILLGLAGHDQLYGGDGDDELIGREGDDVLQGEAGDDVIVAIDGGTGDSVSGGTGRDTVWVDRSALGTDRTEGIGPEDRMNAVQRFANQADSTLDGDRITDPMTPFGHSYRAFESSPLFSSGQGPRPNDVQKGALEDSYLLASLSSIARDNPHAIRQNIVDFRDGTYGVRLGDSVYRVDNDLPAAGDTPAYAQIGSFSNVLPAWHTTRMWVAIFEKAFAYHRPAPTGLLSLLGGTASPSYASLTGGTALEVYRALGLASAGEKGLRTYTSDAARVNDIAARVESSQAVTITFTKRVSGLLVTGNAVVVGRTYSVVRVDRDTYGNVTGFVLRNPSGRDETGSDSNTADGLVTITPAQLALYDGRVTWNGG